MVGTSNQSVPEMASEHSALSLVAKKTHGHHGNHSPMVHPGHHGNQSLVCLIKNQMPTWTYLDYPLVNLHNYGKSPFFMGKSTIDHHFQ